MRTLTIFILAILAIVFAGFGYMESVEARRQTELAIQGERRALLAEANALMYRDRAEKFKRDLEECRKNQPSK